MYLDRYRPTLWGTLCQQAAITRALWVDYFDAKRAERRRARYDRQHSLATAPGWRSDVCLLLLAAAIVLCLAVLVALQVKWVH